MREGMVVGFPTAQTNLWKTNDATVFMPTQSGRVKSALYGSTRTALRNGRAVPRFHEAIDLAPLSRDGAGRALDDVFSIADGRVVYVNRSAGASSYGRYIVIRHDDTIGPVYSLYSHLAGVSEDLNERQRVKRGALLGRMGHSSTLGIPRSRSHLHFEVCLMLNSNFEGWLRKHKMGVRHGAHHGWNLTGIDPLALYPSSDRLQLFSMEEHLASLPVAFELILRSEHPLDYFERYPALWQTRSPPGNVAVVSVSHGGVIVAGRPATAEELKGLGRRSSMILGVDADALGRNGPGLIRSAKDGWKLTAKGRRWVDFISF